MSARYYTGSWPHGQKHQNWNTGRQPVRILKTGVKHLREKRIPRRRSSMPGTYLDQVSPIERKSNSSGEPFRQALVIDMVYLLLYMHAVMRLPDAFSSSAKTPPGLVSAGPKYCLGAVGSWPEMLSTCLQDIHRYAISYKHLPSLLVPDSDLINNKIMLINIYTLYATLCYSGLLVAASPLISPATTVTQSDHRLDHIVKSLAGQTNFVPAPKPRQATRKQIVARAKAGPQRRGESARPAGCFTSSDSGLTPVAVFENTYGTTGVSDLPLSPRSFMLTVSRCSTARMVRTLLRLVTHFASSWVSHIGAPSDRSYRLQTL